MCSARHLPRLLRAGGATEVRPGSWLDCLLLLLLLWKGGLEEEAGPGQRALLRRSSAGPAARPEGVDAAASLRQQHGLYTIVQYGI